MVPELALSSSENGSFGALVGNGAEPVNNGQLGGS